MSTCTPSEKYAYMVYDAVVKCSVIGSMLNQFMLCIWAYKQVFI